jgi:hypothetical protein
MRQVTPMSCRWIAQRPLIGHWQNLTCRDAPRYDVPTLYNAKTL